MRRRRPGGRAGAGEGVAGDVGGEHEGLGGGAGGNHGGGHAEAGGGAVAGFLDFDAAAGGGQLEESLAEAGGGLGLIHAGFGGENHQLDVVASGLVEKGQGGIGGEGDDVLVGGHDGPAFLADADDELVGVHAALFREGAQVEHVGGGVEGDEVDADFHFFSTGSGDGGRRAEDRGRRTEDRGRKTEDGGRRTEDGGRKTEDGGRKTEDGGRKTEDRLVGFSMPWKLI
jgi:hypothetical protein